MGILNKRSGRDKKVIFLEEKRWRRDNKLDMKIPKKLTYKP